MSLMNDLRPISRRSWVHSEIQYCFVRDVGQQCALVMVEGMLHRSKTSGVMMNIRAVLLASAGPKPNSPVRAGGPAFRVFCEGWGAGGPKTWGQTERSPFFSYPMRILDLSLPEIPSSLAGSAKGRRAEKVLVRSTAGWAGFHHLITKIGERSVCPQVFTTSCNS